MLETNLSVVTVDGSLYSFIISYREQPGVLVYRLPEQLKSSLATYANSIMDNPKTIRGIRDKKWNMRMELTGIYVKDDVVFYQLELENSSAIDYEIQSLRFYICDRQKGKRTASQEIELRPLETRGNRSFVKANSQSIIVVALEKFTIPEAKYLAVECMERNGGRTMKMKIGNNKILRAIPLSSFY